MTDLLTDRFLRLPQVLEISGLSKAMVYKMIRTGRFPAPYKPGGASSRWSEAEISEWVVGVKAARNQESGA
jgi:prophage regulatory protein